MDIVEEIKKDRESGARRLEAEYKAGLLALARRFCNDSGDAEELVNRTFAAVVEGIDDYLEQSAFFGWMCQILVNIHSKDRRKRMRQLEVFPGRVPDVVDETSEEEIYGNLDASLLRDAIETLPEDMREAIVLHYFTGLSVPRIAKFLTVPEGTVKSRLHYARKALAAKLGVASRKPGARALLLALALFGMAALGAAVYNLAVSSEAQDTVVPCPVAVASTSATERQADESNDVDAADIRQSTTFADPLAHSVPSAPSSPQETTTMKNATMLSAAAVAAATFAMPVRIASGQTVAYWDFGSDAEHVADASGNWNELRNGGVTFADGAAVFDGTAKAFSTRRPIALSSSEAYTIECFVKSASPHSGMIMELSSSINNNTGGFYLIANEGLMARSSNGYNGKSFSATVCDGGWHHVAVVVNPVGETAADQLRLFVDGVEQTAQSQKRAGTSLQSHILYIGSRGGVSNFFNGQIDDIRISRGALSTDDFLSARTTSTGLPVRAYWTFDSGDPLADASGNSNTLLGDAGVSFANGCASFDGTASNVRTSDRLDLSDVQDLTVECFVRKHASSSDLGMILEHSDNYWSNSQGFYVALNNQRAANVNCEFKFSDGNGRHSVNSPEYCVNAGWHHVAVVKDSSKTGTQQCTRLYIDGVLQTEPSNSGLKSDDPMRNDYLYLGSRNNETLFLDADVDDVRITAQVLEPWQFLRTRTGPLDETIAYWPFKSGKPLVDASGNGNVLTGSGVTVSGDHSAVFSGAQSGFATLAPLPLYPYDSVTVEWFMKSSMTSTGVILETSTQYGDHPGAFGIFAKDTAGFRTPTSFNVLDNG